MDIKVKIMLSERGKTLLVINNYKFYMSKKLKRSGQYRWTCISRCNCRAMVHTLSTDFNVITKCNLTHNHPEVKNILRQALSNAIKSKPMDNLLERPSQLIYEELNKCTFPGEIAPKDIKCIRRNMWNARECVASPHQKAQTYIAVRADELRTETIKGNTFY